MKKFFKFCLNVAGRKRKIEWKKFPKCHCHSYRKFLIEIFPKNHDLSSLQKNQLDNRTNVFKILVKFLFFALLQTKCSNSTYEVAIADSTIYSNRGTNEIPRWHFIYVVLIALVWFSVITCYFIFKMETFPYTLVLQSSLGRYQNP